MSQLAAPQLSVPSLGSGGCLGSGASVQQHALRRGVLSDSSLVQTTLAHARHGHESFSELRESGDGSGSGAVASSPAIPSLGAWSHGGQQHKASDFPESTVTPSLAGTSTSRLGDSRSAAVPNLSPLPGQAGGEVQTRRFSAVGVTPKPSGIASTWQDLASLGHSSLALVPQESSGGGLTPPSLSPGPSTSSSPRGLSLSIPVLSGGSGTAGVAGTEGRSRGGGGSSSQETAASIVQQEQPSPNDASEAIVALPSSSAVVATSTSATSSLSGLDMPACAAVPLVRTVVPHRAALDSSSGGRSGGARKSLKIDLASLEAENPVAARRSSKSPARSSFHRERRRSNNSEQQRVAAEETFEYDGPEQMVQAEAVNRNRSEYTHLQSLRRIYDRLQRTKRNNVNKRDLILLCRVDVKVANFFQLPSQIHQEDGSRDAFERCFQDIDIDGDREISWEEFVNWFERRFPKNEARRRSVNDFFEDGSSSPQPQGTPSSSTNLPSQASPAGLQWEDVPGAAVTRVRISNQSNEESMRMPATEVQEAPPTSRSSGGLSTSDTGRDTNVSAISGGPAVLRRDAEKDSTSNVFPSTSPTPAGTGTFLASIALVENRSDNGRNALAGSEQRDEVVAPREGLGGTLSAFGPPSEWWHDAIILGRLSAVAMRYFSTRATRGPWEAWRGLVAAAFAKRHETLRSQRRIALRSWRWRTLVSGRRMQSKMPLIRTIMRLHAVALQPAFGQLKQAVFLRRDLNRKLKLLYLVEWKMLNTLARAHYYQSLLRLGIAGFWMASQLHSKRHKMKFVGSAAIENSGGYHGGAHSCQGHVALVVRRVWRRWCYATQMWLTSAEYRVRETEAWLIGDCTTPRSIARSTFLEGSSNNDNVNLRISSRDIHFGLEVPFPIGLDYFDMKNGYVRSDIVFQDPVATAAAGGASSGGKGGHGDGPVQLVAHTAAPHTPDPQQALQRRRAAVRNNAASGAGTSSANGRVTDTRNSTAPGAQRSAIDTEAPIAEPPQRRQMPRAMQAPPAVLERQRLVANSFSTEPTADKVRPRQPRRQRRMSGGSEPDFAFVEPEAPSELESDAGSSVRARKQRAAASCFGLGDPSSPVQGAPSASDYWAIGLGGNVAGAFVEDGADYWTLRERLAKQQT